MNFLKYQAPAICMALLIFIASSITDIKLPEMDIKLLDKWTHLIEYGIFGILLAMAYFKQNHFMGMRRWYWQFSVFTGALYGISDELHQYFVPGRHCDGYDIAADVVGVVLGAIVFGFFYEGKMFRFWGEGTFQEDNLTK